MSSLRPPATAQWCSPRQGWLLHPPRLADCQHETRCFGRGPRSHRCVSAVHPLRGPRAVCLRGTCACTVHGCDDRPRQALTLPPCHLPRQIPVSVVKVTSAKRQLPFRYYSLPMCTPEKVQQEPENIGQVLAGSRIENSDYKVRRGPAQPPRDEGANFRCAPPRCSATPPAVVHPGERVLQDAVPQGVEPCRCEEGGRLH